MRFSPAGGLGLDALVEWREPRVFAEQRRGLNDRDVSRTVAVALALTCFLWLFGMVVVPAGRRPGAIALFVYVLGGVAALATVVTASDRFAPTRISLLRGGIAIDRGMHRQWIRHADIMECTITQQVVGNVQYGVVRLKGKDRQVILGVASAVPLQRVAAALSHRGVPARLELSDGETEGEG